MATKPKAILSTHDGREVSPITRASNVLFENGQTAQDILNDRQDAMISPVIENSSSMFKVGQGDDVDYSANVVNGAYESMVLKGKSMVNCIQESSSQDVVLPYEFEDGQYVTINDTKESGALGVELKGQTLVNLINSYTINAPVGQTKNWYASSYATGNVKAGKYMLIYNLVKTSKTKRNTPRIRLANDGYLYHGFDNFNTTPGIKKWIFTADSDLIEFTYWITDNEGDIIVNDFILLEYQEGMENWDIPYFEGMQSVRMPVLTTTGKNLFDKEAFYNDWKGKQAKYIYKETVDGEDVLKIHNLNLLNADKNGFKIFVKKDVPLTLTFKCKKAGTADTNAVLTVRHDYKTYKDVGSCNSDVWTERSATFTPTRNYITICSAYIQNDYYYIKDIQLEQGTQKTPYEPYKSSILSTSEDVELRGIGNVKDTLDCLTGELTERIGEIVLDGSDDEEWEKSYETTNAITFRLKLPNRYFYTDQWKNTGLKNDCGFEQVGWFYIYSDRVDKECYGVGDDNKIYIRILKSRLNSVDENGFKSYLSKKPITIQYLLKTETIKTVDFSIVDQNGNTIPTLKSWNTTTHIHSEIPENSLYPILSHSNPSYPVILKPSTKYSIVANSYSNDHTNSAINFNLGGATVSTTVGSRVTTITTPSTLTSEELVISGRGNKLNNVMVVEGDVVGDEPYFEGMCDSKSPILSNVGKNLYPVTYLTDNAYVDKIRLKANTRYTLKNSVAFSPQNRFKFRVYDLKQNPLNDSQLVEIHKDLYYNSASVAFCNNRNKDYIECSFTPKIDCYISITSFNSGVDSNRDYHIQLEEGSTVTTYEPYKSNILSCETYFDETTQSDKTIVLRSLPNGVCDTLNVETGEYVQRIGEVVLDGSVDEEWTFHALEPSGKYCYKTRYTVDVSVSDSEGHCDKLIYVNGGEAPWNKKLNCVSILNTKWLTTYTEHETLDSYKQWLSQNPLTVQYELETPIVSTIDVQGFPYAYTNGHVQLSSGHSGQSLTPKVEYSVVTNRNGQIRSNQKMVERHQKQLDQLQAIILANLVNSQYNQTLTTLKYELSRV